MLFGGSDNILSDTWEWDGSAWTQRNPATSPTQRFGHAMAYDSRRQRVFLHGGTRNFSNGLSDSWEWDGTTWTRRTATNEPETWANPMVFDSARQRMMLFISNATWVLLP